MAVIPVDKAQIGMMLAAPISDRRGRLLMPAGKELGNKHLDALPMWGISHIEIEGDEGLEEDLQEEVAPWAVAQAGEEMAHRFLHADLTHPAMKELNALAVHRRALHLQREGRHDG